MNEAPVAELTLALLGNPASFDRMIEAAEARLDKFAGKVDAAGARLQAGLDKALGGVAASAGKLDQSLQPVVTALGDVAASASVAGAEVRAASGELRAVSGDARAAASSLTAVGTAGRAAGAGVAAGMGQTVAGTAKAEGSLSGFLGLINRVRAAAARPIVQKVTAQRTGGGGPRGADRGAVGGGGYAMLAAGGAILGAEGALVKQGLEFDDNIQQLYAHAGETAPMDKFKRSVLGVAQAFDQLPQDAAASLYPIESAGHHGAEALQVLSAAAGMARGTTTDLSVTTALVTKTLTAYGLTAGKSGQVTDIYTNAIRDALVTGKEFVPALSNVLDVGSKAGLTVQELSSALAMMTRTTKSAATGSTYLKAFISGLIGPTKATRDAAKEAGLEWLAAGRGAEHLQKVGLAQTLREINAATKGGSESNIGKLFPDMRKNQALLSLLRDDAKEYAKTLKDVQKSGGAVAAANKVQDNNPAQEARKLKAEVAALGANLETGLAPSLLKIGHFLDGVLQWFNRLSPAVQTGIAVFTGAAGAALAFAGAATVLGPALAGMAEVVGSVVAAVNIPVLAVAAAVGLVVVAWTRDWGHIREVVASLVGWARPYLGQFAAWLSSSWKSLTGNLVKFWASVAPQIREIFGTIAGIVKFCLADIVSFWEVWGQGIWGTVRAVWDGIKGLIKFALDDIEGLIRLALDVITGNWGKFWTDLKDSVKTLGADFNSAVGNVWADLADGFTKTLDSMGAYWDSFWAKLKQSHSLTDAMNAGSAAAAAAHGGQTLDQAGSPAGGAGTGGSSRDPYGDPADAGKAGRLGLAIAMAAQERQDSGAARTHVHRCQQLARETVQARTHIFDGLFAGSAKETAERMKARGLAEPLTPQTVLKPGDLLYSTSLGSKGSSEGKFGHVQTVGPTGDRLDQYGRNHFALSNFQYVFDPDRAAQKLGDEAPLRAPKLSTDHSLADAMNNKAKKAKTEGAGPLQDISLKRLDAVLPLGDLHGAATGAANYEEKLRRLNEALAETELRAVKSGKGYNTYTLALEGLAHKLVLAENAARNTQKAIDTLSPKVNQGEAALGNSRNAYNALTDRMKGQRQAGIPKSDPSAWASEIGRHEKLRQQYSADMAAYERDATALKENQRVHDQAVQNQTADLLEQGRVLSEQERNATERFLKAQGKAVKLGPDQPGGLSRDAYDRNLRDALAGKNKAVGKMNPEGEDYARIQDALTQSQIARQAASEKVSRETLQLQKKDFQALQQDLDAEVQAYRDAGVAEADVAAWRNLKQHELDMARSKQGRDAALAMGHEMAQLGMETQAQLQADIAKAGASLTADIAKAQTPAEAQEMTLQLAKLKLEFDKIDWDAAAQKAEGWRQALDTGKLGIEEYVLRLKDLQANLPQTSEEYKRLTGEINSASREIYQKAEQAAGGIASKMTDSFMGVIHKATTMRQAVRDLFGTMIDDAVKKQIEDTLKKVVLKMVLHSDEDKAKKAAEKAAAQHKKSTDTMQAAAAGLSRGADTFKAGVATFAAYVEKFAAAASQAPPGPAAPAATGGGAGGDAGSGTGTAGALISGAGAGAQAGGLSGALAGAARASGSAGAQIGASILPDLQKGNDGQAALSGTEQAASMGFLGNTAASVMPYLGAAIALASLLGPHHGYAPTKVQDQRYANVLSSFSPTIDSGYSGADGLRTLLGPVSRTQAGVSTQGQAGGNVIHLTIAPGAFQGVADPVQHGTQVVQTIHDGLARMSALDNASRGEG